MTSIVKSAIRSAVKSVMNLMKSYKILLLLVKSYWISWNPLKSQDFNKSLLLLAKLCWILWNCVKSCWFHEILWNSLAFSKVLLDFMKYFAFSEFHEILMLLMKYIMKSIMKSDGFHMNLCWISWELVKSCWIYWNPVKFCRF